MKKVFTIIFLGIGAFSFTQGLVPEWAHNFPFTNSGYSTCKTALDSDENLYVSGTLNNFTVDLDPGPAVYNLSPQGIALNYICKYTKQGDFLWVKTFVASGGINNGSVEVDPSGNILVTGYFRGTADFDPGTAVFNITSPINQSSLFIAKLDQDGNFIWAKGIGMEATGNTVNADDITTDAVNNVYVTGRFYADTDFDPGAGVQTLAIHNVADIYILKLDANGTFVWAKNFGGTVVSGNTNWSKAIEVDEFQNVYCAGTHVGTTDFDPGPGVFSLTETGTGSDPFILKLDPSGNLLWAKAFGTASSEECESLKIDSQHNVIVSGSFNVSMDFDPGPGTVIVPSLALQNAYVLKLNANGDFVWARNLGNGARRARRLELDNEDNILTVGEFQNAPDQSLLDSLGITALGTWQIYIMKLNPSGQAIFGTKYDNNDQDIDYISDIATAPNGNVYLTGSGSMSWDDKFFLAKFRARRVSGSFYKDLSENCTQEAIEKNLGGMLGLINPGGFVVQSNTMGYWFHDSLAPGSYTLIYDSLSPWKPTCGDVLPFSVSNTHQLTQTANAGFVNENPCTSPLVSVNMPFMRRCFTNQQIFVRSCNDGSASDILTGAYTEVQLDENLIFQSASISSTDLGNNLYRFNHGDIYPGNCVEFTINADVSCNAVLGQTLCIEANMYPVADCVLDTIPAPTPGDFIPCSLPWDRSSLRVEGWCANDSIYFTITNTGDPGNGDMDCYSPVRLYIDGEYIWLDSIMLTGGETFTYAFAGDGRSWRLEADQHPLHPGNSHPNAHVEACGDNQNWTPDLVTILPQDDADPVVDIFCDIVRGSYDPNDKRGFPTGVSDERLISANQDLEYVIRFQNTGTDTAFTVVVRDTLDVNLNIFTVQPGVSSHDYSFRMYGPRVLEWTFNNIMLPDSTNDEPGSHGFVTFRVAQNPSLAEGITITNDADIYFDFNDPIITNETSHTIGTLVQPVLSVQEIQKAGSAFSALLYPNPTESKLTVYLDKSYGQVSYTVTSVSGQVSDQKSGLSGKEIQLDLENRSRGIYFLKLTLDGKEQVFKVVKE